MRDQEFLALVDERIGEIARAVFHECMRNGTASAQVSDDGSGKLREQLALIKAKEHVTVREAAILLSCSESHLRKLVTLARKGKTRRPIPYVDMEGVTVFPREILLDWATPAPHLQVDKDVAAAQVLHRI